MTKLLTALALLATVAMPALAEETVKAYEAQTAAKVDGATTLKVVDEDLTAGVSATADVSASESGAEAEVEGEVEAGTHAEDGEGDHAH